MARNRLVSIQDLTVAFGGAPILDEVSLQIHEGERLCLLGRNGSGKSTLLRALQGTLEPDGGEIIRATGLRTAMLEQSIPDFADGVHRGVADVVASGHGGGARHEVEAAISRVGLEPDDDVATLSAGQKRRVLLARALVTDPQLLLLDEPTNHLDLDSIQWLEEFLLRQGRTLFFVTHDRAFLRRLATRIIEIDRGNLTSWEADYDRYRERKEDALRVEAGQRALFDKKLAEEEVWIRRGVRERRKRNMGRVRELMDMREDRAVRRDRTGTVKMEVHKADASGRIVARAKDVSFAFGDKKIVEDLSIEIDRGDRIGLIGPNGSGKTTLIRLLLGELEPDSGTVRLGSNLQIAYFDQLHAQLDERATAAENICDRGEFVTVNGKQQHVIGYLRNFLFTPEQTRFPVKDFSGGERNRLLLARLLARPSNVLVLDEPTNDLDVETLELLEALLDDYEGTILIVSHDREFLDDLVTTTLVLEGDGRVGQYAGGYTDWQRQAQAQRKAARRAKRGASSDKASGTPGGSKATPAKSPKPKPSLTKDERKALKALPAKIESLEGDVAKLHDAMAAPDFYKQDGAAIAKAQARLATLEAELEKTYERWEALEAKAT